MERRVRRAGELRDEQVRWAGAADPRIQPLVAKLHGPLVKELADQMGYEDGDFVEAPRAGFPIRRPPPTHRRGHPECGP